jgi:hypothetical protein
VGLEFLVCFLALKLEPVSTAILLNHHRDCKPSASKGISSLHVLARQKGLREYSTRRLKRNIFRMSFISHLLVVDFSLSGNHVTTSLLSIPLVSTTLEQRRDRTTNSSSLSGVGF